ncbi:hypothetical protein KMW28_05105 [Flammeovirga yaeyamensis]|uniref:DUF3857 domain-containing protein n=1 Tax=Flammeovirga yaeyamensis TaxID=367791 RepID=A0AAX1N9P3_9BACT|nr:hypothetical protein [Flammeovirga yaeyamensis]MBB3697537.1 hypothetical protein [Flammeovirga yaeyamensis]NMF36231.1 hypothetical protein [Flammeovirga yaeyamensis]QWG02960.1 hypothetical protein KMW28_05105 [Flammeovirga yaeyamensis]
MNFKKLLFVYAILVSVAIHAKDKNQLPIGEKLNYSLSFIKYTHSKVEAFEFDTEATFINEKGDVEFSVTDLNSYDKYKEFIKSERDKLFFKSLLAQKFTINKDLKMIEAKNDSGERNSKDFVYMFNGIQSRYFSKNEVYDYHPILLKTDKFSEELKQAIAKRKGIKIDLGENKKYSNYTILNGHITYESLPKKQGVLKYELRVQHKKLYKPATTFIYIKFDQNNVIQNLRITLKEDKSPVIYMCEVRKSEMDNTVYKDAMAVAKIIENYKNLKQDNILISKHNFKFNVNKPLPFEKEIDTVQINKIVKSLEIDCGIKKGYESRIYYNHQVPHSLVTVITKISGGQTSFTELLDQKYYQGYYLGNYMPNDIFYPMYQEIKNVTIDLDVYIPRTISKKEFILGKKIKNDRFSMTDSSFTVKRKNHTPLNEIIHYLEFYTKDGKLIDPKVKFQFSVEDPYTEILKSLTFDKELKNSVYDEYSVKNLGKVVIHYLDDFQKLEFKNINKDVGQYF